jgi:hypothetical protein
MNILGSEHIFHVFRVHPQDDGSVKRQFIGRFLEHDGEFHILEDHDGVLAHIPEGPITGDTNAKLEHLRRSSYIDIVTADDLKNGRRLDLLPAREFDNLKAVQEPAQDNPKDVQAQRPPSVFEYVRDGQTHTIEFRDGQCFLDSQHLDRTEALRLLEHHRQGYAVVRYRKASG